MADLVYTEDTETELEQGTLTDVIAMPQGLILRSASPNLLTENQSNVETDLTGFFGNIGGTEMLTRVTSVAFEGVASLQVDTPGANDFEGVRLARIPALESTAYSGQARVQGTGTVQVFVRAWDDALTFLGQLRSVETVLDGTFQLIETENFVTPVGTTLLDIAVLTPSGTLQAITFFADAFQLEQATTSSPWQPGGADAPLEGNRISPAIDLSSVGTAATSVLQWNATQPKRTLLTVEVSLDGGMNWLAATNGGSVPGVSPGADLRGKSILIRETLLSDPLEPNQFSFDFRDEVPGNPPNVHWFPFTDSSVEVTLTYEITPDNTLMATAESASPGGTFFISNFPAETALQDVLNADIIQRFRFTSTSSAAVFGVLGILSGTDFQQGNLFTSGTASNVSLTALTSDFGPGFAALAPDTWYWSRVQFDGDTLRIRFWIDGTTEPTEWALELSGQGARSNGSTEFGATSDNMAGTVTIEWDYIGIGISGAEPPRPL